MIETLADPASSRSQTTRNLHSFLNDLSAASLDWQDPPPEVDSAPSPSVRLFQLFRAPECPR